jgi:molybdopterin-guanine dinucleotide biosynthesis protein A
MSDENKEISQTRYPMTGVVLTGGESNRLGFNKAFVEVGGRPIVERVLEVLRALFEEVLIITLAPEQYEHLGCPVYTDLLPGNNAMGGIHAALSYASSEKAFVCACDMPFLNPRLVSRLVELSSKADVVVPRSHGGIEPLHAVYSKGCLPAIERAIETGSLKLIDLLSGLGVRLVEGPELDRLDPEGLSFFNVNTAEDLEAARRLARQAALPPSAE